MSFTRTRNISRDMSLDLLCARQHEIGSSGVAKPRLALVPHRQGNATLPLLHNSSARRADQGQRVPARSTDTVEDLLHLQAGHYMYPDVSGSTSLGCAAERAHVPRLAHILGAPVSRVSGAPCHSTRPFKTPPRPPPQSPTRTPRDPKS